MKITSLFNRNKFITNEVEVNNNTTKNNSNDIVVVKNTDNYGATTQIPTVNIKYRRSGFISLGIKDGFYKFLQDLYLKCPVHHKAIELKKSYVIGNGLKITKENGELINDLRINENVYLSELYKKWVDDYVLYGGFAYKVKYFADGKYIFDYLNLTYIRVSDVVDFDTPKLYVYSSSLGDRNNIYSTIYSYSEFDSVVEYYNKFNYQLEKGENGEPIGEYINVVHKRAISYNLYPEPSYVSGLDAIQLLIENSASNLKKASSGWSPRVWVNKIGTPDAGKNLEEINEMVIQATGTDGTDILFTQSADEFNKYEISPILIPKNFSDNIELINSYKDDVYVANDVPKIIAENRNSGGGLGNNANEMATYELSFTATIIKDIQDSILNEVLKLLKNTEQFKDVVKIEVIPRLIYKLDDKEINELK